MTFSQNASSYEISNAYYVSEAWLTDKYMSFRIETPWEGEGEFKPKNNNKNKIENNKDLKRQTC